MTELASRPQNQLDQLNENWNYDVVDFKDKLLSEDKNFWITPTFAIGRVVKADSSLKKGKKPRTFMKKLLISFILTAVVTGLYYLVINLRDHPDFDKDPVIKHGITGLMGLLTMCLSMVFIRTKDICCMVGTEGAMISIAKGSIEQAVTYTFRYADNTSITALGHTTYNKILREEMAHNSTTLIVNNAKENGKPGVCKVKGCHVQCKTDRIIANFTEEVAKEFYRFHSNSCRMTVNKKGVIEASK